MVEILRRTQRARAIIVFIDLMDVGITLIFLFIFVLFGLKATVVPYDCYINIGEQEPILKKCW
jgi:hypothetical protein